MTPRQNCGEYGEAAWAAPEMSRDDAGGHHRSEKQRGPKSPDPPRLPLPPLALQGSRVPHPVNNKIFIVDKIMLQAFILLPYLKRVKTVLTWTEPNEAREVETEDEASSLSLASSSALAASSAIA